MFSKIMSHKAIRIDESVPEKLKAKKKKIRHCLTEFERRKMIEIGRSPSELSQLIDSVSYGMFLRKENDCLFMPEFLPENFYRVVYSDMQTQKTPIMSMIALRNAIYHNCPVFIFVKNNRADLDQLKTRLGDHIKEWNAFAHSYYASKGISSTPAEMTVLEPERGKFATQKTVISAMKGKTAKIFISLFSATDINPLIDLVSVVIPRFGIILDEADHLDNGSQKSKVSQSFELFRSKALFMYNVTATPLTVLANRICTRRNFIYLSPPENYKGLCQVTWKDLKCKADPCNKVDDDPFQKDPNLVPFLELFHNVKKPPRNSVYNQRVPRYLLVRLGKAIEPAMKVASYIHKKYSKTITITWNGASPTMRSSLLPQKPIRVGDVVSKYKDGVHTFGSIHIGALISYLHSTGYKGSHEKDLKFRRIIVLAGELADRGITFGADNFKECRKERKVWWHLTDMYYLANRGKSKQLLSIILQVCGRICGVYEDNVQLSLYSNWVDGIREAYILHQELLDRIKKIGDLDENILENLTEMKVHDKKKPGKIRLTSPSVPEPIKWTPESDIPYGGWSEEERSELLKGSREVGVEDSSVEEGYVEAPVLRDDSRREGWWCVCPEKLSEKERLIYDRIVLFFFDEFGAVREIAKMDLLHRIYDKEEATSAKNITWHWDRKGVPVREDSPGLLVKPGNPILFRYN